jgi:uncharacterized glyoxalase superfamily protein PhnB
MSEVSPIPDNYTAVTPYLIVLDALALFEYLQKAFKAQEVRRTQVSEGHVLNIEIKIIDAMVMLVQARANHKVRTTDLYHYVKDVDKVYRRAIKAGGTSLMEPKDMFYGERQAGVKDPAGNHWWISSRIESLTTEELSKRAANQ